MNPSKIVIGLGFGDEGKGLTTEYLSSVSEKPLVIRYSGGQQAGHTVCKGKHRHVFSNFGSGTLSGAPTYWSKFCTVDPIGLTNELDKILNMGVNPNIYIDAKSPVTTPFDMLNNQTNLDNLEHGSCGLGVGSTFQREQDFYSLTFFDLFYPSILLAKLNSIAKYYGHEKKLKMDRFLECVELIKSSSNIEICYGVSELTYTSTNFIYESSQGLLLDQNYGFFPNVTRSYVGTKNLKLNLSSELYLITRAYQTRHGNGFMSNTNIPHNIKVDPRETNKDNEYQGVFRKSLLDLDLLIYGINKDEGIRNSLNKKLVITCLDHIENEYRFTYCGKIIHSLDKFEFISKISKILNIDEVLYSESPYSNDLRKF